MRRHGFADSVGESGAAPLPEGSPLRLVPEHRGSETILLVDDNAMFRELAALALRSYGYTVIDAQNGEAAIVEVSRHNAPIDLVVTDVIMPQIDGRALVRAIRGVHPNIRVLFMSGYARAEAGIKDHADDATGFLAKPFHVNELAAAVRWLLDSSGQSEISSTTT